MMDLTQTLAAAVADLQAFQAVSGEYEDLPERIAQARLEAEGLEASLRKARTDLRVTTASLTKLKAENVRKHRTEEEEKLQALRELEIAIGEKRLEFDKLAQATREAQHRHNNILTTIDALKAKLGV